MLTATAICVLCAFVSIVSAVHVRLDKLNAATLAPTQPPAPQLAYRTAASTHGDAPNHSGIEAEAMEALSELPFVQGERDRWRDRALRYQHALQAIALLHHQGCQDIAEDALASKGDRS